MAFPSFILMILLVCTAGSRAAELVLVHEGRDPAPIVLEPDATPFTREAAEELARCLGEMSGAVPELLTETPEPLPDRAIWIGYQPVLETLLPQVDFTFDHPEEILIAATSEHLAITGRDRYDPAHLQVVIRRTTIEGKQQEYGTVNAVYTFLQDHLGVRWLWPGELGEDIPKRPTISLAPFTYRYHPQIRHRMGVLAFSSLPGWGYGRSRTWSRRQRLQLDSLEMGGHAFMDWGERFHETHPEYLALQPDGSRGSKSEDVKLCLSNPAVARQWLADVREDLRQDPTQRVFSTASNDGWMSGHCVCESCRAWDPPDGEKRLYAWRRHREKRSPLSDRHVHFANRCARLLAEAFPDRDYHVVTLAYGHSRPAPLEAVPDHNVIIASVANFYGRRGQVERGSPGGSTHREQFAAWGKVAPHLIWRPNSGSPAGAQQGQLDVFMQQVMEDWRFIAEHGCIGIWIDMVWEHWATQGPQYYLMTQLTWNPYLDGDEVMADYYRRGFGPGADAVAAYWQLAESAREQYVQTQDYLATYDAAFFSKAHEMLAQADAACANEQDVYRQRIKFIRAGLRHQRLMIDIRRGMAHFLASQGSDQQAAQVVRSLWDQVKTNCEAYPYAVHWGPIRPLGTRLRDLHPDNVTITLTPPKPGQE